MSSQPGPDPGPAETLADLKRRMRRDAKRHRAAAHDAIAAIAAPAVRERFLAAVTLAPGIPVGAYWPFNHELDVRPLLSHLQETGTPVALPIVVGPDRPLLFRLWRTGEPLLTGRLGEPYPAEGPEVEPQVLLVPLLAFDRQGFRLGYGGGFYDRTLAGLRARPRTVRAVGLGYAAQEVPAVPHDEHDQQMDLVLTERETIVID